MLLKRRLTWAPLFVLILISQMGYIWVYRSNDRKIRKEAKAQLFRSLRNSKLELIELDVNAVNWVEEGKEFQYNGEMYDVVKQERKGSRLVFHCINDHEENALLRDLSKKIWEQNDPSSRNSSTTFFKVLPVSWFYAEPVAITFPQFATPSLPQYGPEALVQADLLQHFPPPKA